MPGRIFDAGLYCDDGRRLRRPEQLCKALSGRSSGQYAGLVTSDAVSLRPDLAQWELLP